LRGKLLGTTRPPDGDNVRASARRIAAPTTPIAPDGAGPEAPRGRSSRRWCLNSVERLASTIKYVLGLLNSRLLDFFLKRVSTPLRGGFFRYFTQFVEQLPIRPIDFSNRSDRSRHDKMVELVDRMLALHKQLAAAKAPPERANLQAQIDATDRRIDRLVYELYGLTDAEIALVEEVTAR
jgi:hypothetical protein